MPQSTSADMAVAAAPCRWQVGDKVSVTKPVRFWHIRWFARASFDTNPIHLDEEAAKKTIFGRIIAHGMLSASRISAVLGTQLPGRGSIYLEQTLKFLSPVFPGDDVTVTVEVIAVTPTKRPGRHHIRLKTECTNQGGNVVLIGEALILQ
jgi:3-hydroxybutyryl-CoA dehydratase